jgi:hypothetical protein
LRNRPLIVAAALSLVVTAALVVRVLVIDKPAVMIILIPPIAGALLVLWKPGRGWAIAIGCILTAVTAVISLVGGVGLLYVPSIALYLWGSSRPSASVVTPSQSLTP